MPVSRGRSLAVSGNGRGLPPRPHTRRTAAERGAEPTTDRHGYSMALHDRLQSDEESSAIPLAQRIGPMTTFKRPGPSLAERIGPLAPRRHTRSFGAVGRHIVIPDEDAGTLSNDLEETATVGTSIRMKRASTKPVRALGRVGKTKAPRRRTVTSSEAGSELDDNSMLPTPVERSFGEKVASTAETPSAPPMVSLAECIKVLEWLSFDQLPLTPAIDVVNHFTSGSRSKDRVNQLVTRMGMPVLPHIEADRFYGLPCSAHEREEVADHETTLIPLPKFWLIHCPQIVQPGQSKKLTDAIDNLNQLGVTKTDWAGNQPALHYGCWNGVSDGGIAAPDPETTAALDAFWSTMSEICTDLEAVLREHDWETYVHLRSASKRIKSAYKYLPPHLAENILPAILECTLQRRCDLELDTTSDPTCYTILIVLGIETTTGTCGLRLPQFNLIASAQPGSAFFIQDGLILSAIEASPAAEQGQLVLTLKIRI